MGLSSARTVFCGTQELLRAKTPTANPNPDRHGQTEVENLSLLGSKETFE